MVIIFYFLAITLLVSFATAQTKTQSMLKMQNGVCGSHSSSLAAVQSLSSNNQTVELNLINQFTTITFPSNSFALTHNGTILANGDVHSAGVASFEGGCAYIEKNGKPVPMSWAMLPCKCKSIVVQPNVAEVVCGISLPAYFSSSHNAYAPSSTVLCTGVYSFQIAQ